MGLLTLVAVHCATAGFQTLAVDRLAKVGLLMLVALADHLATAGFRTPVAYHLATLGLLILVLLVASSCVTAGVQTLAADHFATARIPTLAADHLATARIPMSVEDLCPSVAKDTMTRLQNFPVSPTQVSRLQLRPEILGVLLQGPRRQRGRRKG
jgi:hypothetical protein